LVTVQELLPLKQASAGRAGTYSESAKATSMKINSQRRKNVAETISDALPKNGLVWHLIHQLHSVDACHAKKHIMVIDCICIIYEHKALRQISVSDYV
jgi:hypothetical protein